MERSARAVPVGSVVLDVEARDTAYCWFVLYHGLATCGSFTAGMRNTSIANQIPERFTTISIRDLARSGGFAVHAS